MGVFELWSVFIIVIACAIAWVLTQQIQRIGRQQPEFGRLAVIVTICVWVWLGGRGQDVYVWVCVCRV